MLRIGIVRQGGIGRMTNKYDNNAIGGQMLKEEVSQKYGESPRAAYYQSC